MAGSRVELYAAIRRDARDEGLSSRALALKYSVGRRTVALALESAWPAPRKQQPPRRSRLDPYKLIIDGMLRVDLDAPRKQKHTVTRVFHRLLDEYGALPGAHERVDVPRGVADGGPLLGSRSKDGGGGAARAGQQHGGQCRRDHSTNSHPVMLWFVSGRKRSRLTPGRPNSSRSPPNPPSPLANGLRAGNVTRSQPVRVSPCRAAPRRRDRDTCRASGRCVLGGCVVSGTRRCSPHGSPRHAYEPSHPARRTPPAPRRQRCPAARPSTRPPPSAPAADPA